MKTITSYIHPDLDGTASAIAYAEFLQRRGDTARALLSGKPDKEASAALAHWQITPELSDDPRDFPSDIVLVDVSNPHEILPGISPQHVVEIIDHRGERELEVFPHARAQIDLVGAAATLVAERFHAANITPTPSSAGLLLGAIASNTFLFRSSNTTDRDRMMFDWLRGVARVGDEYLATLRRARSTFGPGELRETLENDAVVKETPSGRTVILQLEAEDAESILRDRKDEILAAFSWARQSEQATHVFLNAIDLRTARNTLFTPDRATQVFLTRALSIPFSNDGLGHSAALLLRKEITPRLKAAPSR